MSLNDPKAKVDGFQGITQGVDSGRHPAVLNQGQLSWLINGTTRGGFPTCRPGWRNRPLNFFDETFAVDTTVETNFKTKLFQGAGAYVSDAGKGYLFASIGGRIFNINLDGYAVTDITPNNSGTDDPNSATEQQTWFCQAENFLIIQNGEDRALIFDGSTIRRSNSYEHNGGKEVPTCTVMTYHNGRLWGARPNGKSFVAGDLAYSLTNTRADIIKFTGAYTLSGGGDFTIPTQAGSITALRSIAVQDSVTGQGPLQVFTSQGGFSINVPFDREQWQTLSSPLQTISVLSQGATSQNSTVLVNGDIWYRSPDGIRSFVIARRDHGTWVNTPVSREVERGLGYDTPELLNFSSAVLFDNRLICTVRPQLAINSGTLHGTIHKGLVVMDFAPVSHMLNRAQPVWDGLWTGLDVLQILTVETPSRTRCFMFALNSSYEIELWELTTNERFDSATNRIEWVIETPSYGFDTGGWNLRQLGYGDVWMNRLAGQVDMTFKFRPDGDPQWQSWGTARMCAQYRQCSAASCSSPIRYLEQYRSRLRLPEASTSCDSVANKPRDFGYRFATRIEITGFAQIQQFRLIARDQPEDVVGGCPDTTCTEVGITDDCAIDDFSYEIPALDDDTPENVFVLQDPDTLLWYEVSITYTAGVGYEFSFDSIPVSAGTTPSWILQDEFGVRYEWTVSMTAFGLELKNFGTTSDTETPVSILADDGTERIVSVGLNEDGSPFLMII